MTHPHVPVLAKELSQIVAVQPGDRILDATVGFGGHARVLLPLITETGRYYGIDQDPEAIAYCRSYFDDVSTLTLIHGNFAAMQAYAIAPVNCVIFDLGVSSHQLDAADRGFGIHHTSLLDMRMSLTTKKTAASVLNSYTPDALATMFETHADLKSARLIQMILTTRDAQPFETTDDLRQVIKRSFYFNNSRRRYIAMLQRVFQAIRIEVNAEAACLIQALAQLPDQVQPGGRVAIIAFHSGESRLIKAHMPACFAPVNKKVIKPDASERHQNTRAACAQLRVYAKL